MSCIYLRLSTGFDMLVFFTNLSFIEFQVRCLTIFCLFSVIDGFEWFWMESLQKNISVMLNFLKAPFLVLHFSHYSFDLPDNIICNIPISTDDTAFYSEYDELSDLRQRLENCCWTWIWSTRETQRTGTGSGFVDFNAGKSQLFWAFIQSVKFLSPEVAMYLYESTIRPCMICYLEMLKKLQKRIFRTAGPSLAARP